MPPYALILCSAAAVLGALAPASQELPVDARVAVGIALLALGAFAISNRCKPPQFRALLLATLVSSAANAVWHAASQPHVSAHRTATYGATVLERAPTEFVVELDSGLRVRAFSSNPIPAPGTHVLVRGRLEPFDQARNPGEPSERALQRERGLDAKLEVATILSATPASQGCNARCWLARAHEWAHARLAEGLGEPAASVVAGELWGERASLPPDLRGEFQETGTVHVLVTAGLHVGAVAALCVAALSFLALPRTATCAIVVGVVWLFAWWSGDALPAMRAATMTTAALAARACGRATLSWNALALAAIVVVFVRPYSVTSASFALSFSCVGAIFSLAGPFEAWLAARTALPTRLREALVLTLATQCGTWPIAAAVFLQFAPYAALANLVVVPCVGATMALGALQISAVAWPPIAQAAANLNSWLLALMLGSVHALANLPFARVSMTPAPVWCILVYDAALAYAPWLVRRGGSTAALVGLLVGAGFILTPPRGAGGHLLITVLDVGQADAIVVRTPAGHALLVDAGGRLERGSQGEDSVAEAIGERIVVPFLLRSGIHDLDAIVLSHPHGDHAGGVAPVLRRLRVRLFGDGGQRYGGHAYRDALATAASEHVPLVNPRAGARWSLDDGVTLDFLGPSLPLIARSRNDINENSVAFLLRYRWFCMLFTGDAGAAAEERFLAGNGDLRCDVLKVGHHGSAYGSTARFVRAVRPRYAIVSVGRHNLFGHPAAATISTLRRYGAIVLRTDENGAVTIESDGTHTTVTPMFERADSTTQ